MNKTIQWTATLMLSLSLVGCATTTPSRADNVKAAEYYAQLGVGYLQKGRVALASENLEKALAKNPNSTNAQHFYALLQDKLGKHATASIYFRKALKNGTKDPELLNNYGSHLCQTGHYAEAVKAFLAALNDPLYPTPEFARTNAGVCLQKQGHFAQAEQQYRLALQSNPNFAIALYRMAELAYMRGQNPQAQAFLYRYNEQAPETPETLLLCHRIHRALSENTQAEHCATNLLAKFPKSSEAASLN